MAKPSDKSGGKSAARKGPAAGPRDSDEILPVRQLSILIVDDDPVDRMTVRRVLKGTKLSPKITEATDIASAIDLIKKNGFDVVLLDHILPDGKSIDLLRKLRDAGARLPVVIITGYGDEMLVADLLKIGAADYLSKDRISTDTVMRVISHAIRIHKIEEEKLKKDTLLEAGAEAVILLNTQTERISVVSSALGILGKALNVDRLTAFEQAMHATAKLPAISHRFEWSRDSEDFKVNDPSLQNVPYLSLDLARWHAVISSGHPIDSAVRSLPPKEQPFFTGRGVISFLAIPVFMDGRCWGFVLIEDNRMERIWTEWEKSMLTRIATAIGTTLMHRRADDALRQSEERFRTIVESQTDCICRFLPNGVVTFVNEAWCQYFGRKREEFIGRPVAPYVAEEDRQILLDPLAALRTQNPFVVGENRMIGPDGSVRWRQWTNRGIFNPQGQLVEIQSVGHDITNLKRVESALRDSEFKYRTLVEQIPAITYTARMDEASTTEYISPQIETILGYTPADYKIDPDLWRKLIHSEDRDRVMSEVAKAHAAGSSLFCKYRMTAKDGHVVWVHDSASFLHDSAGKPILMQGVMYDVSDQRKAEDELEKALARRRELETVINQGPAIAFLWRNAERWPIEFVSDNIREFGFTVEEVISGKVRIEDLIHADDLPRLEKEVAEHLQKGHGTYTQEYRMLTRNGVARWVEDRTHVIRNAEGQITHFQGVVWDVSKRKEVEQELRESRSYLDAIINTISDPIFVKDSQHRFVMVNEAECALAGTTREQLIGKTDRGFFPKEQVDIFWKYDEQVLATGREIMNEENVTDAYDRVHTIITKKTRYTDPAGRHYIVGVVRDITDRKKAEDELRHNEEQWRAQYKGFPIPTYTWTFVENDFVLTDFNDAAQAITDNGITKHNGCKLSELYKNRPDIIADIHRCFSERSTFCREMDYHFTTTGKDRCMKVTYVFVPPNQVMAHTDDVTERRSAEAALRDSEAQYRTLAEASPDMIFMCAPNSDIIYTNSFGARQWNLRPEQVARKKQEELFPPEIVECHKATIRHVCETKKPLFSEVTEMLQPSKVWIETRLVPITNAAGEVTAVLGVSRDITERRKMEDTVRESEVNFRALAENAMDGIVILSGENGRFVYSNKAATNMSGYTAEEILQRSPWDFLPLNMETTLKKTFQKKIAGDPSIPARYETLTTRKDGQQFPVDLSVARTVWRGKPAVLIIARDVSLHKKLEEERSRLATNLLEIQEKERQNISAMLHDHLGQLLTLTRLELGSVASYDANSKKSINNAIERLDEALESVRRLAVSLRPPILDDLGIEVALETLTEEFADGSGIQTSFTHTGPNPALGNAGETCLYRVLQETLTNAARHSGATRIDVQLRTTGRKVCLEIHDNGKGFDPKAQKKQRGIGIIGMRERLSYCRGTLDIISETGKGTTIRALIPKTDKEVSP